MAPFLAAAFAYMSDPTAKVDLNAIWAAVPSVLHELGVDDAAIEAVSAARGDVSAEQAREAVAHVLDFMREATGLDPAAPVVVEGINEIATTMMSGRYRSFIVDKFDRSRLLERLSNAPWRAFERARAPIQFTMNRPLDGALINQFPSEARLAEFMRGHQGALANIMRGSPWFVTLHFAIWVEDGAPAIDARPERFT
jgi:hypothetical protein